MTPAAALTITAAGALLLAGARRGSVGPVEPGPDDTMGQVVGVLDVEAIAERAEQIFYVVTEDQSMPENSNQAAANVGAFLDMILQSEGTANAPDPYRVCYGYRHTIENLGEHPAITGEWRGEVLPAAMCANAGFGPGCVSTAAGGFQIIKPTWSRVRNKLSLPDFSADSQRRAAVALIGERGALADVQAGRFAAAVHKCRAEWASLPGNYAKQGQRSIDQLQAWYSNAGGEITA